MRIFKQKDIISQQILSDLFDGKLHTKGKLRPHPIYQKHTAFQ